MARDARQTTPDQRDSVVKRFACDTPRFTYDARHLPIGEVQPGELFQVETIDCFSGLFQHLTTLPTRTSLSPRTISTA